jgi:hypothetical protein
MSLEWGSDMTKKITDNLTMSSEQKKALADALKTTKSSDDVDTQVEITGTVDNGKLTVEDICVRYRHDWKVVTPEV